MFCYDSLTLFVCGVAVEHQARYQQHAVDPTHSWTKMGYATLGVQSNSYVPQGALLLHQHI